MMSSLLRAFLVAVTGVVAFAPVAWGQALAIQSEKDGSYYLDPSNSESVLRAVAQGYQLGAERTGALAALYQSLPALVGEMKVGSAEAASVISDLEYVGRKIQSVQTPRDYRSLLSDNLVKKYGLASRFPLWDPYFQTVSVDPVERALEDQVAGKQTAISNAIKSLKHGAPVVASAAKRLDEILLQIPSDLTSEKLLNIDAFRNDPTFNSILNRIGKAKSGIGEIEDEGHQLVERSFDLLREIKTSAIGRQIRSVEDLVENRSLKIPSYIEPGTLRAGASALTAFAAMIGDKASQESARRVAKIVDSSAKVYQTAQLLLGASSGIGTFMAVNAVLDSGSSLRGGASNENSRIMETLGKLIDYLQSEFAIVNGKLDYVVASLDRIESKVDEIGLALAGVAQEMSSVSGKLDQIKQSLGQAQLDITKTIWSSALAECEGLAQGGAFETRERFVGCVGTFVEFGEHASKYPFILAKAQSPQHTLRDILDEKNSDAITYSRYAPLANAVLTTLIPGSPMQCPDLSANQGVLWKATQNLSSLATQRPELWASIERPLVSRIERLLEMAKSTEDSLKCLAPSRDILQHRWVALEESYQQSLRRLSEEVEKIDLEAQHKFYHDIIEADANSAATALTPWYNAVPKSDPMLLPLAYCDGELPKSGSKSVVHVFTGEIVKELPRYLTKSHELLFERDSKNLKSPTLHFCVAKDETYVGIATLPKKHVAATIQFKLHLMRGQKTFASVDVKNLTDRAFGPNYSRRDGSCLNAIECISEIPKLREFAYGHVRLLANDKLIADDLINFLRNNMVLLQEDEDFRRRYAIYLQSYLRSSIKMPHLLDLARELDTKLAALKYIAVMAAPTSWAWDDFLRLSLDGNVGVRLMDSATFQDLIDCQSAALCSNDDKKSRYQQNPPFWWNADKQRLLVTERSRLENFQRVAERPYRKLAYALQRLGALQDGDEPYHPLAISTSARLDGLLHLTGKY